MNRKAVYMEQNTKLDIDAIVEALSGLNNHWMRRGAGSEAPDTRSLPSPEAVKRLVEGFRAALFPGYFGTSEMGVSSLKFHLGATLDTTAMILREQVKRGLCFACDFHSACLPDCENRAASITGSLLERLPSIRKLLSSDVLAAYRGDPAATSPGETIFCYPGILALTCHRIAHELHLLEVPLLPRMMTEHAHSLTGIDIHPGARIGDSFFIDHGTGIVIGETCVIGDCVSIYQGVTLGAKSFPLGRDGAPVKGLPRHPVVEDNVIIYSGATILGRVTIGRGSVIGGNVWLTTNIPPGSRITQTRAREEKFENGAGI